MKSRSTPPVRFALLAAFAAAALLLPSAASAAKVKKHKGKATTPEVQACIDAYKKAQSAAQEAHLREAKDSLAHCTKPACPAIMRQECTNRYMQLDSDIPSVIPVVTDDTGTPRSLVEVRMDGELLTSKLDGHALPVDPGKHDFVFATEGGVFAKKSVMIVQGQRNRPISVVYRTGKKGDAVAVSGEGAASEEPGKEAAAPAAPPTKTAEAEASGENEAAQATDTEEASPRVTATRTVRRPAAAAASSRGPGVLTYVTAGLGVVGVTGYFLMSNWGKKDNDMLSSCAPNCDPASVDHVHKLYVGANISGAVGLALLATSAVLYYRSQTAEEEVSTAPAAKPRTRTASLRSIDIQPTPSGALASVGGSF